MAVFKLAKCSCGYLKNAPKPGKEAGACPKCSKPMRYLDNWYISYQVNGKKYVEAVGSQKRDAEAALGKIKGNIKEGRFFDKAPSTSWPKAVDLFRAWFQTNVKSHTVRMYENSLKVLGEHFERYTLDKISAPMVERFKSERASQVIVLNEGQPNETSRQISAATVNRDLATLKRLFSLAEQWGLVEVNKIRKVRLLKENNARIRYLTADEEKRLLAKCTTPHLYLAVLIALNTGLRKEGIFTLRWSEVDFTHNKITKVVKGDKKVHIPLTAALREALLEKKRDTVLSQFVLPSDRKQGSAYTDLKKSFAHALRAARIKDFRFHDLRHTFATNFLRRTKDINALREILGHSDLKMTMRYAHILDEHIKEAMETFEKGAV